MADAMDFADQVREWRRLASVARTDIDAALADAGIEVPDRFTSQLENRRVRAPDRNVCDVIARVVGRDPSLVWELAVRDRMTKAGVIDVFQDLLDEKRRELTRDATPAELGLLERVREHQRVLENSPNRSSFPANDTPVAAMVSSLLDTFVNLAAARDEHPENRLAVGLHTLGWIQANRDPDEPGEPSSGARALAVLVDHVEHVIVERRRFFRKGFEAGQERR